MLDSTACNDLSEKEHRCSAALAFTYNPGDILRLAEEDTCILHVYKLEVALDSADVTCDTVTHHSDVDPSECIDGVTPDVGLWLNPQNNRDYQWTSAPTDMLGGGWGYAKASLEPSQGAPCATPSSVNNNIWYDPGNVGVGQAARKGGFRGTIGAAATIAICCANHCGETNTPVDQDLLSDNPSSTIDWVMYPGSFGISRHSGEPCTFFQASVPAGDYWICCSACFASGLFFTADVGTQGTVSAADLTMVTIETTHCPTRSALVAGDGCAGDCIVNVDSSRDSSSSLGGCGGWGADDGYCMVEGGQVKACFIDRCWAAGADQCGDLGTTSTISLWMTITCTIGNMAGVDDSWDVLQTYGPSGITNIQQLRDAGWVLDAINDWGSCNGATPGPDSRCACACTTTAPVEEYAGL